MRERYETVINKQRYTFDVAYNRYVGPGCWLAKAFLENTSRFVRSCGGSDPESAALRLVEMIEEEFWCECKFSMVFRDKTDRPFCSECRKFIKELM